MHKQHIPAFLASIGNDTLFTSSFANQASAEFKRKVRWKIQFILDTLSYGYRVLYVDSDVILLKNPFAVLESYEGYDLIAQGDQWNLCTGFFYLPSREKSIGVMKVAKDLVYNHDYQDQVAVNQAVKALNASILLLPQDAFPSGLEFFSKYQYYWDRKGDELKEWLKSRQRLLHLPQQLCERTLREGCAIQGDEDVLVGCEWRVQW